VKNKLFSCPFIQRAFNRHGKRVSETDVTFESIDTMPIDFLYAVLNKVKNPSPLKPRWHDLGTLAVHKIRTLHHPSAEIM